MLRTVTAATSEPVTLAEAKAHLRVTHALDDTLIESQITSARELVEMWTGLALADAEYLWAPEHPPRSGYIASLPIWPATVATVTYWDGDTRLDIEPDEYDLDDFRGVLRLGSYSRPQIGFTAVPDEVPESLKSAIKLLVMAEYEAEPDEATKIRDAAFRIAFLHRRNLGV